METVGLISSTSVNDLNIRGGELQLQRDNAQLRAALKPFADAWEWIPRGWDNDKPVELPPFCVNVGHFRAAKAVYNGEK